MVDFCALLKSNIRMLFVVRKPTIENKKEGRSCCSLTTETKNNKAIWNSELGSDIKVL